MTMTTRILPEAENLFSSLTASGEQTKTKRFNSKSQPTNDDSSSPSFIADFKFPYRGKTEGKCVNEEVDEKDDEDDFKVVDFNHLLVGIESGNADSLWTQVIAEPRKSFGHKEKLKTKQNTTFNQVKLDKNKNSTKK